MNLNENVDSIIIDVSRLYPAGTQAKLSEIDSYVAKALELTGEGRNIVITGAGPVWLYLRLAHAVHGKARSLSYRSPVTGDVLIFNHNPY